MVMLTHWLRKVARLAPRVPIFSPKMKIGSRIMFSTPPVVSPTTDSLAFPCQRSRLFRVKDRIITGAPRRMKKA